MVRSNIISYESSIWYIKVWRQRWYIYAIFLHAIDYINIEIWIDRLLGEKNDVTEKKLKKSWVDIKRHVEVSKMYKFSKSNYERD